MSCAAALALALLCAPTSADAQAPEPIAGKLSRPGYTVIALADNGQAVTDQATKGAFKLKPPASEVTLHLRAPDGTYAGPIVLQQKGNPVKRAKMDLKQAKRALRKAKRRLKKARHALKQARRLAKGRTAVLGIKAEAESGKKKSGKVRLGKVRINSAGFAKAKLTTSQWKKWVDQKRVATARKGVPIGAGNFGRVVITKLNGPSYDPDRDGIPNPLDIDDDGDLILDDIDTTTAGMAAARAQAAYQSQAVHQFEAWTNLSLGGTGATGRAPIVNANATNLSFEQIESGLQAAGQLQIGIGAQYASGELNCGAREALIYCSPGGTGRIDRTGNPGGAGDPDPQPFPGPPGGPYDPDGDGFGTLPFDPAQHIPTALLLTGAGAGQIRAGDLLLALGTTPGGEQQELATTLQTVFDTTPALASYTDELGVTHQVSYPYSSATSLPVVDGPDAGTDVSVRLNFWRPQRRPISGEAGDWIDIGGLQYFAEVFYEAPPFCPQSAYSEPSPNLTPGIGMWASSTGPLQIPVLSDSAPDQAANPANTFSYTLDLSQCGQSSFNPGQSRGVAFKASFPPLDTHPFNTVQSFYTFTNQP